MLMIRTTSKNLYRIAEAIRATCTYTISKYDGSAYITMVAHDGKVNTYTGKPLKLKYRLFMKLHGAEVCDYITNRYTVRKHDKTVDINEDINRAVIRFRMK